MGKRFLVSLLLIILIVGGAAVGAGFIFSSQYEDVKALEKSAAQSSLQEGTTIVRPMENTEERPSTMEGYNTEEAASLQEEPAIAPPAGNDTSLTRAKVMVEKMTLEEKICQMLFVTPEALTGYTKVTQSGNASRTAIEQRPVGGIIYFGDNLVTMEQTTEMIKNIQSYSVELTGRGLFIGVDEEGGTVARVADNLGTTAFEDMATYGAEGDTAKAYEIGKTQAEELTAMGFNVNFSPVADVLTNEANTVVKERSFGSDPELVADMTTEVIKGLTEGGMLCAPKHFPGHGSTDADTHNGFAASDRTLQELENCDLIPFRAAITAGAPMIMVGHMTMTELDDENPACMSGDIVTGLLREKLGYDGIIITDALNMGAIYENYTNAEAAVACIAAGCDMLLCVSNINSVVSALTTAVEEGVIKESAIDASVTRILTAKYRYGITS